MDQLCRTTEYLKAMAHPVRLQIINVLRSNHQLSVTQLADMCRAPGAMISGHLRLMKDRGLLHKKRQGKEVFYRVSEPALVEIVNSFIPPGK